MKSDMHDQALAIVTLLRRLTRRLFTLDPEDPATDLPVAQLRVCGTLLERPRNMSCLSKELGISLSAATQIADRLERSGLVERICETDDRRVKCLQLTERGEAIMRARRERRAARVLAALERLSPEERESVLAGINTLMQAADALPAVEGEGASAAESLVD